MGTSTLLVGTPDSTEEFLSGWNLNLIYLTGNPRRTSRLRRYATRYNGGSRRPTITDLAVSFTREFRWVIAQEVLTLSAEW